MPRKMSDSRLLSRCTRGLYIALLVSAACNPGATKDKSQGNAAPGSGDAQENTPFGRCVAKALTDALTPTVLPATPDFNLGESDAARGTDLLQIEPTRVSYSRSYYKDYVSKLKVTRVYHTGNYAASDYSVKISAKRNDSTKDKYLEVERSTSIVASGRRQSTLTHTTRIAADDACTPTLTSVELKTYAWDKSGKSVKYTKSAYDAINSIPTRESKDASAEALIYTDKLNVDLGSNAKLLATNLPFKAQIWEDGAIYDITLTAGQSQNHMDLITGDERQMRVVRMNVAQNGKSAYSMDMLVSDASEYGSNQMVDLPNREEFIERDLWLGTKLPSGDDQFDASKVKVSGITHDDLYDFSLTYELHTGAPLAFKNYPAYFDLKGTSGDNTKYVIRHRQPRPIPELDEPPVPATSAEAKKYLGSSYYLNTRDSRIQAMAKKVLASAGAQTSQRAIVAGILKVVTDAIKYDHAEVNNDSVTLMRDIDALSRGTGVCQHFAAVFVSVARAAGLPARVVSGFLLNEDDNTKEISAGGHAWVEIMISGRTWLPLEPQSAKYLYLPDPQYLPVTVMDSYERQAASADDLSERVIQIKIMDGMTITKISGAAGQNVQQNTQSATQNSATAQKGGVYGQAAGDGTDNGAALDGP